MTKPDKHSNRLEPDAREDFPELKDHSSSGPGEEEEAHSSPSTDDFDDLESSDDLLGASAGMGKEIKIGLAVIAGLLVVLAVVVVRRITRPSDETVFGGMEAAKHENREHFADGARPTAKGASAFSPAPAIDRRSFADERPAVKSRSEPGGPALARAERKEQFNDGFATVSDDRKTPQSEKGVRSEGPVLPRESGPASPSRFAPLANGGVAERTAAWSNDPSTSSHSPSERRRVDPVDDRSTAPGNGFAVPPGTGDRRRVADIDRPAVKSGEPRQTAAPFMDKSPAATSPPGAPAGSFGSSGADAFRDRPVDRARTGEPESDRGFRSTPRELGGVPSGVSPRDLPSPPQMWNQPQSVGIQTPQAPQTQPATVANGDPRRRNGGSGQFAAGAAGVAPVYGGSAPGGPGVAPPSGAGVLPPYDAGTGNIPVSSVAPPGMRTYVVQPGETVYDIAHNELGSALRWNEIYQLNRDVLAAQPTSITPGMRLLLPQDAGSPGVLTQRPGAGQMR